MPPRKKPIRFSVRLLKLLLTANQSQSLVQKSYDSISDHYDQTWTNHMRDLTQELINKVDIQPGHKTLDLTCGTGYATRLIAERTTVNTIGVDNSAGMLDRARKNCPPTCDFVHADILDYLKKTPNEEFDIITCCWGLGYSYPLKVLKQINRVLKKGGRVGIIDNTLFSLHEIMYCSMLTFMEQPDSFENLMKFRFLAGKRHLSLWLRLANLKPLSAWQGSKAYEVSSGFEAIGRLHATGAAAGFEYAAKDGHTEAIFCRFAEILEQKYMKNGLIPIIHRYAGGIAVK